MIMYCQINPQMDRIQLGIRKAIEQLRLSNAYFSEITMQHIDSVNRGLLEVTKRLFEDHRQFRMT